MAQITYIADCNLDYDDCTCRFFRSPKDAEAWANNNEDYQDADIEFEFGEDITTDTYEIVSGTVKYSKGLVIAINGGLGEYTFPEQFMIQDMSQEECIAELKKLEDPDAGSEFDEMFCSGAFFTKAVPGKGDDYAWLIGGGGGTEFNNGRKDFNFYWQEGSGEISYNAGKEEQLGESVQTLKNVKLFEEFINEASSSACKKLVKELKKRGDFQAVVDNGDNSITFDYQYEIEDIDYDCNAGTIFIADDETGEWNRDAEPNADAIATELTDYLRYT